MILRNFSLFLTCYLLGVCTVHAAGNAAAGSAQYALCGTCHGSSGEGVSTLNAPKIAGLSYDYLVRQLMNYRRGIRGTHENDSAGMQMKSMADSLKSIQEVEDIAAYVASLPDAKVTATVQGDVISGKNYWVVCSGCHGVDGLGNAALGAPRLIGMSDWYLVRQLNNYKKGLRGADPKDRYGQQMIGMANMLPDEKSIKDVVSYIQTLE